MRKLSTLFLIIITLQGFSQQLVETCYDNPPSLPAETIIPFCNDSLGFEFYENQQWPYGDPDMDIDVGMWGTDCTFINYDLWGVIEYPDTATGFLCLNIFNGDCINPDGDIGNHGPLEGWQMMLWEGDDCNNAELVWGSPCYWMTEDVPGVIDSSEWSGITEYDPTVQSLTIIITDATPGQNYFIQLDSFSWCLGCGEFAWCYEPLFLDLDTEQTIEVTLKGEEPELIKITNTLYEEVRYTEFNTIYFFHYSNGDVKKQVIIE